MRRQSRAFTLIELLVVVAIVSILAAILFPVFAQAREKARAVACLSNMQQIGFAVQMYVQDNDDRLFYRANWAYSRSGDIPYTPNNSNRWWNQLMPYVKAAAVFTCPDDPAPTLSVDTSGNDSIPRSYIAVCPAESLTLNEADDPVETIVITEKWSSDYTGPRTDSWIEPFNGDFTPDATNSQRMFTAGNRHTGLINCAFLDGHAAALHPRMIQESAELTGCSLIYQHAFGGANAPGYSAASGWSASTAPGQPDICATSSFSYASS